jgi:hypothetical protein
MKLLGGFLNFHVWNPKPLLLMLDFIRQSLGLGAKYIHDFSCLNMSRLCLSTWMLTIWHQKTMCLVLIFLNLLCPFESWSNPRFDQDLNQFKTWKWKWKPGFFLVTPKWSFWEFFQFPMFETQNHFSSCLTS